MIKIKGFTFDYRPFELTVFVVQSILMQEFLAPANGPDQAGDEAFEGKTVDVKVGTNLRIAYCLYSYKLLSILRAHQINRLYQ